MVQTIYIYNQCDMVAEQPQIVSKEKVRKAVANFIPADAPTRCLSLFTFPFTLKSIYRKQLKLARAAARVIDHHPTLSNVLLVMMGVGFLAEVILFG